ncbi:retrovirus-related pol polyprotein from transposon TNT 1-94 [Tanacetum coccineum]|uniref:Retrovirus-related pol polyprotein from transposon TNT 1-94 n=1 Tax=Tanacetum coccineum TaxID=301880 RepID=A0ABQ5HG04_9ASTR
MSTSTNNSQMHNDIMAAGSKERPPMLTPENRKLIDAEAEAIHMILNGIGNDICSTVNACPTAWEINKGNEIVKPLSPPSESTSEEESDEEQAQRDKHIQKSLALIAKHFKNIYRPTNNNLKTSLNTRNKNVDTSPKTRNDRQTRQFGNQRTITVDRNRETVGNQVVQKYRIQCFNCKGFGHFAKEFKKPKRVKDYEYHKEKMMLCKKKSKSIYLIVEHNEWLQDTNEESDKQELEAHYMYMEKIQEILHATDDNFGPTCDVEPLKKADSNVIPDSSHICDNEGKAGQNIDELEDEHEVDDLKMDVDDLKSQFENEKVSLKVDDLLLQECLKKDILYVTYISMLDSDNYYDMACKYLDKIKEYLEVAFRKSTCFVRDLQGNDLLTGTRRSNLYTIALQESSSQTPICFMAKASPTQTWLWHCRLSHLNFDTIYLLFKNDIVNDLPMLKYAKDLLCSSCEIVRDGENLDKIKEKGDPCIFVGYATQSKGYRVYNKRIRLIIETIHINFDELKVVMTSDDNTSGLAPQQQKATHDHNNEPSSLKLVLNVVPTANEIDTSLQELEFLFSPMYEEYFDEGNKSVSKSSVLSDNLQQQDTQPTLNVQPILEPIIPPTNINAEENNTDQTKDHPLEQVRGNASKPVQTRRQLATKPEMCMFVLTMSKAEPNNIKEAMADHVWIEAMQEEFHQFDRLNVLELVDKPLGKTVINLKWLWKNKKDETILLFAIKHDL